MRVLLVVLAVFLPVIGRADEAWQKVIDKDGVTVERRPVAGSRIYETRAITVSQLTPDQIFRAIDDRRVKDFMPYLKRQDVLEDKDNEVLLYSQIRVPLVSDRDYVVRARHSVDPVTHVHRVDFHSADPEGPPSQKDYVRVRDIRGSWELRPRATGGTDVIYTLHSDPGGSIPIWIINLVQKREAPKFLRLMLDHAQKLAS